MAALGDAPGFSAVQRDAESGVIALPAALGQTASMAERRGRATTLDQRAGGGHVQRLRETGTLCKALRRSLEHDWEHLAEPSRQPGGPLL